MDGESLIKALEIRRNRVMRTANAYARAVADFEKIVDFVSDSKDLTLIYKRHTYDFANFHRPRVQGIDYAL